MDTPRHVTTAKWLLTELDQRANDARAALYRSDDVELVAALDRRDHLLAELEQVVDAMAHERGWASRRFPDLTTAAAAALESQQELYALITAERDRLAVALRQMERPDAVADQYAPTPAQRSPVVSVVG